MQLTADIKERIFDEGFAVIENIFDQQEINEILTAINNTDTSRPTFRKTNDLFAIRQFLKEVPGIFNLIFTDKLKYSIAEIFGRNFFVVKSIYFDKPAESNWFVAYHQDLTISVDKKFDIKDFGSWTTKQDQFAVQPPLPFLEDNFTIRIHLDNANEDNGALKVISKSHLKGIYRQETIDWTIEKETICSVEKGGVMFMKPLLLHSSGKTINNNKRRVIHIEFSNKELPMNLKWSEYATIF